MPEAICDANEPEDATKAETTSSPESASCTWSFTTLKSPQQSLESKPSPNHDEQELIDITTVKAEDSVHTKSDMKPEIDNSQKDVCNSGEGDNYGNTKVNGETNRAMPFDSGSTQPSQQIELNNVEPNAGQNVLKDNATDNQEAIRANSTTNFEEIQNQLKKTLDHIEQRKMVSGFRTLSEATNAVVEHCEQLGLTSDDHPYNAIDREQFWAGLNNCWLYALAQRQEPCSTEEKMNDQQLCSLRERVVAWADKLERYGLVDYEMGWWEADILAAMDAILATNYASAQAVAQAAVAKAAAALFGDETNG